MARAMAADRDWVRWTIDPVTGQLLDRGATTYRPSDKLRASSPTATGSAASPAATAQPNSATATTSSPSPTTARPSGSTSARSAASTTTPRPTACWKLSYDPDTGIKTWTSPLGKTYTKSTDPPLT